MQKEFIAFHDKILKQLPSVAGMPDPERAEALIYKVQNCTHYEGITDSYELAVTYWIAISLGRIFNDGNKRTAFFVTMVFLYRNGIKIIDVDDVLENLTVDAATGAKNSQQLAQHLRKLSDKN